MSTASSNQIHTIARPKRWDHPLSTIDPKSVAWLMEQPPFCRMDAGQFPSSTSLRDTIRNDTRLVNYEPGDLIVRQGDYGGSAFLVLSGQVRVILSSLPNLDRERDLDAKLGWWQAVMESLRRNRFPEVRQLAQPSGARLAPTSIRQDGSQARIFLQDVAAVLQGSRSEPLSTGEIFGEMAALTRSASHYTVVAETPARVLEIRWQGLRLLRRDPQFRAYLDQRYREMHLKTHLRECWLLQYLPEEQLEAVASAAELVSFGDREWFAEYAQSRTLDVQEQIEREPLIAQEGTTPDYLYVVRAGFARQSHRFGGGHRTVAYLGKGQLFGWRELAYGFQHPERKITLPYQESLRALGFVDLLRIPARVVFERILPFVRKDQYPEAPRELRYDPTGHWRPESLSESGGLDAAFLEFLVDQRLINGRQTMIINTDRCTRCDDCVTACARTHHGNPRFLRQGVQYGAWMFPQACMHCVDPVCMIGCPTGAIARSTVTGTISINDQTCIGCATCAQSCPYNNIRMVAISDPKGRALVDQSTQMPILQATKCDLCRNQPAGPACQNACPHDALIRMDMSDLPKLSEWMNRNAA
jgi:Fe-S-cluster-containing dehydrogenase component